jgi:hypothetical protein
MGGVSESKWWRGYERGGAKRGLVCVKTSGGRRKG